MLCNVWVWVCGLHNVFLCISVCFLNVCVMCCGFRKMCVCVCVCVCVGICGFLMFGFVF